MNLGFKIEISANIYKLPGRILTYTQLVDQIQSNFKERVPLKFKITYSSNDDSESINVTCESDFKQLLVSAAERNMKNIKLKIVEQTEEENILKDLDESTFNWCELIDRFDIEDPQLNQQQSLSCLDKSVNNGVGGLFSEADNKAFASQCDLEEKLNQLDMVFSKDDTKNADNNCEKVCKINENECKLEEEIIPSDQKTERIINLDESAIIFIRSENYSPMPLNFEQEQSTELIGGNQQKDKSGSDNANEKCCKCESSSIDQTKQPSYCPSCSQQSQFLKNDNQIKFFYKINEKKLEQTKLPSSSSCTNNQVLNQDFDYLQQVDFFQGCNQIAPLTSAQITPLIPNFQNLLLSQSEQCKNMASSSRMMPTKSDPTHLKFPERSNENQQYLLPSTQFSQQSSSFSQSPINSLAQHQAGHMMYQNCFQNFSCKVAQEEELTSTTSSTQKDQIVFPHVNTRRKSKTTISHVPIPSKLTTSICVDNGNQSTADHSQISFLNGSNQTNNCTNSILSRKQGRLSTQVPEQSFNQSTTSNDTTNRIFPSYCSQRMLIQQSPHLQMYCSQKNPQQQTPGSFCGNEEMCILQGNMQGLQNLIKVCGNTSQNTSATSPENFVREDRARRLSYKIQCQQVCTYRAKIVNSPKKQIAIPPNTEFSWSISLQNNGESQWPHNVVLRCIEGFNDGSSYSIESAQSSSTVSRELNLVAPSQMGVSKNSFRLCYQMEDEQFKYFGPKVTFELTVSPSIEIDNLMASCGMKLNCKNLSPKGKLSTQNIQFIQCIQSNCNQSQNQDEKITSQTSSCSSISCQNRMSLYLLKLSPSDPSFAAIATASSTSISPIKQDHRIGTNAEGDIFKQITCSNFECTPECNMGQIPIGNLDQFYANQKQSINNLPFRRSININ